MSEALMGNGGTGNRKVVLWENPNPSNAFSAQSITIDGMSKYKHVYCEFVTDSNNTSIKNTCLLKNDFCLAIRNLGDNAAAWRLRTGICNGDTIIFDSATYYSSERHIASGVFTNICVPYQIYVIV